MPVRTKNAGGCGVAVCGVVDVGSGSRCVGVGLAKVRERGL